jgi:hypothetical protein
MELRGFNKESQEKYDIDFTGRAFQTSVGN